MNALMSEVLAIGQVWFATAFAVFLRVGLTFTILPGIGESFMPVRIRLMAALLFTVVITPMVAPMIGPMAGSMPPLRFFFTEAVSGFLLGIGLRLIVIALQVAGVMAAQATSLSQIMGGASPDPQPAMGGIMLLAGITLAVSSGLHVHLVHSFVISYEVLPAGEFPLASDTAAWGIARVGAVFSIAFSLAAPFLIASLLYNLMLGVISKAMPQLMVAFVGAPAITWGSLLLLFLTLPFILHVWLRYFHSGLADPFGAL